MTMTLKARVDLLGQIRLVLNKSLNFAMTDYFVNLARRVVGDRWVVEGEEEPQSAGFGVDV